ncbi:MAG: three-Cys-motif partner protein TcmP [Acidobacteria bacterium]|nr:three-Cys-motif partner protein TcmP [Acidobacteriota bacterium]
MTNDELYERREQTRVKHDILRHYLERFAHIVAHKWESITYIDGFAGPWNVRSPDLKDSSFAIALDELRKARATHREKGKNLRLRCFFLEEDRAAYQQLESFAEGVKDAEIKPQNGSFEQSVSSILKFIREGAQGTFPFIFIDPTGWTGFACHRISPLLKLDPGEVLINFMTSHIRRFLKDENSRQSFEELFGSAEVRDRVAGLTGQDLDDALVREYRGMLRREGRFTHVLPAIVLHPEIDRPHFHLIYATRHPKGVEVFKEAEKAAMQEMERLREGAQRRKREERTGQTELSWARETATESPYYSQLRDRYIGKARQSVLDLLRIRKRVLFDDAWILALESPLVWESDLKKWIKEWQSTEELRVEGLVGRERVPSRGKSHFLVWQSGA